MKQLKNHNLIKGSIQKKRLTCGTPTCHCHKKGEKGHGPYTYLAVVEKGRTKPILLKKEQVPLVEQYVSNYEQLRDEIEKATQDNLKLLKEGQLDKRRLSC